MAYVDYQRAPLACKLIAGCFWRCTMETLSVHYSRTPGICAPRTKTAGAYPSIFNAQSVGGRRLLRKCRDMLTPSLSSWLRRISGELDVLPFPEAIDVDPYSNVWSGQRGDRRRTRVVASSQEASVYG